MLLGNNAQQIKTNSDGKTSLHLAGSIKQLGKPAGDGEFLKWSAAAGETQWGIPERGGDVAGIDKEVQFNDGGDFGAEASFEYDKTTNFLTADNIEGTHFGDNLGNIYKTAIYITPLDFTQLSASRYYVFTTTEGGSSKLSSSGVNAYAKFQIPLGYEATHIDFYASSNDSFSVYSCDYTTNTASLLESGTTNTQVTFSPVKPTGIEGKYNVVEYDPSSVSDEIYGVKITIAKV